VNPKGYISPAVRLSLFVAANVGVMLLMGIGIGVSAPSDPRFTYVMLLAMLCSSPILKLERVNGEYFLLAVYSLVFFNYFAVGDVMGILVGRTPQTEGGFLTTGECVILVAIGAAILGYHTAAKWRNAQITTAAAMDWPFLSALMVGVLFWLLGTGALLYWQTYIITDRSNASLAKSLENLGPYLTTVFMAGQLIQPLGVLILAYLYAKYRRTPLLVLIVIVVLAQVVLGFIADFKGEAMQAGIIVTVVRIYVDGKLPKGWLIAGALFVVFAFPVFQSYRNLVRGEHGVTSIQALQNLAATIQKAIEAENKVEAGFGGTAFKGQSFWERSSLKHSVEIIVSRTGVDKPFQMGATLTPIAATFIPKLLWPDKPSVAVGQVFNKEFQLGEVADTYISPSHVGELYWNFGWPGVIVGSLLIGLLLGAVGSRCGAYPRLSLTRLQIMVLTIYAFAVGSEGSIAVAYVPWLRSIAAIGILHWVFARRSANAQPAAVVAAQPIRPAFLHLMP
jgi:O-antigen polysaccharide polymerase Wzy